MDANTHPALIELFRMMPPPGERWPLEKRVVFLIAMDAILAYIYGGDTHMIWLGEDGEIHIASRKETPSQAMLTAADEMALFAADRKP